MIDSLGSIADIAGGAGFRWAISLWAGAPGEKELPSIHTVIHVTEITTVLQTVDS